MTIRSLLSATLYYAPPIVSHEAQQQHKNLLAHYAHLTVHGVLHLQGYDHIEEAEAAIMEQMEAQILARLGYGDPYAEHCNAH